MLLDWWTTGDNWSRYKGGKTAPGKTGTIKKEQTWKLLAKKINDAGITVARNAKAVGAKITRMEADYKKAFDFVSNTGQGLMDEGKDITEYVKKLCPYYYELDPIMASRASTKPLSMFESEGDIVDVDSEKSDDNDDKDDDEDYNPLDNDPQTPEAEENAEEDDVENEANVEGKKKRPLTLRESQSQKKAAKMHPAVQLLNSLSTAVEHAAAQKMLVKKKEIDERIKVAEAEANWKKRELDILGKKNRSLSKKK